MSKKLNHAIHNEQITALLCCNKENVDWIITTAFYAALHYVDHKIFPLKAKTSTGTTYKIKNFDEYYAHVYMSTAIGRVKDKHTARLELVKKELPSIGADYSWLKSLCWTARYSNYQFANEQKYIDETLRRLKAIKDGCTSP